MAKIKPFDDNAENTARVDTGQWTSNMCACCLHREPHFHICLCAFLCPFYLFHVNARDTDVTSCGCCFWCILGINIWCCMRERRDLRYRQNISGSMCNDCITHVVCHPCALIQETIELSVINTQDIIGKTRSIKHV